MSCHGCTTRSTSATSIEDALAVIIGMLASIVTAIGAGRPTTNGRTVARAKRVTTRYRRGGMPTWKHVLLSIPDGGTPTTVKHILNACKKKGIPPGTVASALYDLTRGNKGLPRSVDRLGNGVYCLNKEGQERKDGLLKTF